MNSQSNQTNQRSRGALRFPGPLLMCFPLVSVGIAIAWLQGQPTSRGSFPTAPGHQAAADLPTWITPEAEDAASPCALSARFLPLHREPVRQQFETQVLRERFNLGPGQPWSLQLTLNENCDASLDLAGLRLEGEAGALHPLSLAAESQGTDLHDPVAVLFDRPDQLHPGEQRRLVVWGLDPRNSLSLMGVGDPIVLVQRDMLDSDGQLFGLEHGQQTAQSTAGPRSGARPTKAQAWAEEKGELELEILRLRGELENALEDRIAREAEYVAWSEMLTSMVPLGAPPELYALLGKVAPVPELAPEAEPNPVLELKRKRSKEVYLALRAMMVVERLDSLDLLESGLVDLGFTGPIVFRQLDERGRPIGTLCADRLRLEGSRIARTLTIVLEDGYERREGQTIPFEGTKPGEERGGTRRIFLQNTDPRPWFESAPELFEEQSLEVLQDDGTWRIFLVHRKLNELLGLDAALGHYRLVQIAGILDDELRGVELEQLDRDGGLIKRLFADRLTIHREPKGMLLLLKDGIQAQGGNKLAFLEGRYRIFLPGADQIQWNTSGLPGLVEAKDSALGSRAR